MFYNAPFTNSMPTATQPYGYAMNNSPMQQGYSPTQTQSQQTQQQNQFTNIIFVSGIEDVKTRWQAPNTEMFYADNDKPLLYKKQVYANGQFDVKTFDINEHMPDKDTKEISSIDLSCYAKISDIDAMREDIKGIKEQMSKLKQQGSVINGTTITKSANSTSTSI